MGNPTTGEVFVNEGNFTFTYDDQDGQAGVGIHLSELVSVSWIPPRRDIENRWVELRFQNRFGDVTDVTIFNMTRDELLSAIVSAPNRF